MKKMCFIMGNNYYNIYDSCKNFISKNYLNDMLLLDLDKTLERVHYKRKIDIDYNSWSSSLTEEDKFKIFERTIEERIKNNPEIPNIIITGLLNKDEIQRIIERNNITDLNIIIVDITKELAYRNYTYDLRKKISYANFERIYELDNLKLKRLKLELTKSNYPFYIYNRKSNNDDLEYYIADFFEIMASKIEEETYEWPVRPRYKLTEHDKYGLRPVHMILGKPKFHSGFDITCETNTEVSASISGVVTSAGFDERIFTGESKWNQRYGNVVEVLDNYGRKQIYAHLRKVLVEKGDKVKRGDLIALSGCSGGARVPHLHFEIRKFNTDHSGENNTLDPLILLPHYEFPERFFTEKPYAEIWHEMCENPFGITDEDIAYSRTKKYIR